MRVEKRETIEGVQVVKDRVERSASREGVRVEKRE